MVDTPKGHVQNMAIFNCFANNNEVGLTEVANLRNKISKIINK